MRQVMVDLETLDTRATAVILSIGAVVFDPVELKMFDTFYMPIDIQSCLKWGLTISGATVEWWAKQSDDARKVFHEGPHHTLEHAITEYHKFVRQAQAIAIWSNGSDFDNAILAEATTRVQPARGYSYSVHRCARTLYRMFPVPEVMIPNLVAHHALDDAIYQVKRLFQIAEQYKLQHHIQ